MTPETPANDPAIRAQTPHDFLTRLVREVGETLRADRCFLYVRKPDQGVGRIAFCWRRDESIPDPTHDWQADTTELPAEDPLFRAALATRPSIYVEDVETAPADVLNRDFEHKTFGHRALVHAHITENGQLWGILQPCHFDRPRAWSADDRAFLEGLLPGVAPIIRAYTGPITVPPDVA